MKRILFLMFIIFVTLTGFLSCKKDKEKTCNLSTAQTAPVDMTISFKAEQTGDGAISSLTYGTGSTNITVASPNLPWNIKANALAGENVSISATGTTTNGSLTVSFSADTLSSSISGSDYCEDENN